ncbi:MAG: PadR family transcriptional regulator, partial [Verrucomicrobiales bacterium]
MPRSFKRSPLALAVLTLLREAPMHPYQMQRLIKERGKDQVINVQQRASLTQMSSTPLTTTPGSPSRTRRPR